MINVVWNCAFNSMYCMVIFISPGLLSEAAGLGTLGAKAVPASKSGTDWQV
jgi:hypothetical protein